ncbi:MAG: SurA N-terminal domain-containing protein, partial [Gammaproteobacteria bacterium]|nr:SurA N-terminal domain-containing protein [Gammaproteobacteria bacterium]
MLQAIREKAQGWIAWTIVILISVPFALWGIQEYLGVGGEPEVAVVNGEKITQRMLDQRVRDFRENLRFSLGDNYSAELFDDARLKPQVLNAMVEERLLTDSASDWNLRTGDAQARGFIVTVPAFQRDGRFDQQAYEAAVRNRGMSRVNFEQGVRQDLALSQLRSGIRETVFVTETDLSARVRLGAEQRTVRYARLPASSFIDQAVPSEEQLRRYYESNQDRYRTPERVQVNYLLLDASALGSLVDVNDEALQQYFRDHRAEFVAREERAMRHILITVAPGAGDDEVAKAQGKADDLLAQLRGGADFASLAQANSDDPGSAKSGGDLGWVERGLMVPAFEDAAFTLAKGDFSDPVRTEFGFHIIQVTDVRGGSDAAFADMRDKVEAAYRKFEAENLYFDYAERLAQSAYENSASLTPAAEALGLTVRTTDWVTRSGQLPAPLDAPKVMNAVFSDDVLTEGHNSELIEVGPQRAVVLRVAEHEAAGVLGFDQNRKTIESDFRRANASELAAQTGAKFLGE